MKFLVWLCYSLLLSLLLVAASSAGVENSKHNLSVTGPGSTKAANESRICIFCHTPHNSSPSGPLWNRKLAGSTYTPYSSDSIAAAPGQPTGASILCLSCHDGTIALGELLSEGNLPFQAGTSTIPSGAGLLGTDLSNDHPISFRYSESYDANPDEFVNPGALSGLVQLDASGQLQCTSCHDAHDDRNGKFLVMSNQGGQLCSACHNKAGWDGQAAHKLSTAVWEGQSLLERGCDSCHQPHQAGGAIRLLRSAVEENNCITCHNGSVASKNVATEFDKISRHPIAGYNGVHTPNESALVNQRHVECVDCHNPHAAETGVPLGALKGVQGVAVNGSPIPAKPGINQEHQLCFRCHGDSSAKAPPRTPRQYDTSNLRRIYNPTEVVATASYHPIVNTGKNADVPSLIQPLSEASLISCSDCHSSDNPAAPRGPHGSNFPSLLAREYRTLDPSVEGVAAYALCYGCHDRNNILADNSFRFHNKHINEERAACNTCHDPHGSNVAHLINFNTNVVSPSSSRRLEYSSNGPNSGTCYLTCHGEDHDPQGY